ncbi:allene oxide synthase-lipoxygenase -like [Paramuricea clavata]|uniref:Allene oxide synthase-lipoxygenase -like n=1 Tax=Paramuricea clavata TaxID=317549 RepID=A0A6S7I3J1_PARCT|nr:allene oxide synthase-lipoxygenase -like [Paramuricea clavata]
MSSSDEADLSGLTQNVFLNDTSQTASTDFDLFSDILSLETINNENIGGVKDGVQNVPVIRNEETLFRPPVSVPKRNIALVTDEELINERKDARIPNNTKLSTSWALRVWNDWAVERNNVVLASACREKIVNADVLTNSNDELNYWLAKFVVEIRKRDEPGQFYPPNSLYQLCCGMCVMISHLLRCHLMMEPTAVASWRNLSSVHPVWKLLYPHTKGIMAINTLGRNKLIPEGGAANKVLSIGGGGHVTLMQKYYRSVSFDSYDLVKDLTDRGVKYLRKFHYKNDALLLWNAIQQFVQDIIYIYYNDKKQVLKDNEIQDWIRDLHDNGYKFGGKSVDKKVPKSFTNRKDLINFLTKVIFTCSCQHAAVNFFQMATYGFHPNSPTLMRQPAPTKRGEADSAAIMATLANKHQAGTMISIVNALTTIYPTELFLGDYADNLFGDASARVALAKFKSKLDEITEKIKKRNEGMVAPYTWLLPERIPNSIAI